MPLTPAEKMRRYREKLKNDPIRYEDYKKKDLIKLSLRIKITELSEKEKADQRKKWREQKKDKREKTESTIKVIEIKKPSTSTEAPTAIKCVNKNHILTIRKLRRTYEKLPSVKHFAA
ncbi:hypothetical protein EVAR_88223_1 [Eumeta japonica]|uniref:Uncharacterized protein n=1 Tax=Eumeta variegata TaxID=151549 RepID=A0A4C1Z3E2_EUMVA|nr:hypothetical protein EVAR_88223_1 [Eumeta japonica]